MAQSIARRHPQSEGPVDMNPGAMRMSNIAGLLKRVEAPGVYVTRL